MTDSPLLNLHRETVQPEWVDYNDHMNVAYYVLVFDHATDALLDHVGLDAAGREASGGSVFVVEAHVTYENEVLEGDALAVSTQVLDVDPKRMHVFHRMFLDGDEDGTTVATNELMILHVDMETRRAAAMPTDVQERLHLLHDAQAALPRPAQAGRVIGIRRKLESVETEHQQTMKGSAS